MSDPGLRRVLSWPLLTLYGLGTTIGAGIYALTGEIAAVAGMWAVVSFVLAALLAGCTAFAFAELSARHPESAGEAVYVREGLRLPRLALAVGLLVVLAGIISAATVSVAFVGYLSELIVLPAPLAIVLLAVLLGSVAAWGVSESLLVAGAVTLIEVGGLILVFVVAVPAPAELVARLPELVPPLELEAWSGILVGSVLAFYAFLGFEDMVNVAEEVRDVSRVLPRAIVLTLVLTTVIYALLASVAVLAVPPAELAESGAPLALIYERSTGRDPALLGVVGVLAMINGALIQIIMASRVLYGLARRGSLPAWLGRVNARTQTPVLATVCATAVVCVLAIAFPLAALAEATSIVMLVVFGLVNLSLVAIKRRDPHPDGVFRTPLWVPSVGCVVCLGFLLFELSHRLLS